MTDIQTTTANITADNAPAVRKFTKWRQYYNIVKELAIVDFRKKYHDSTLGYFWSMLNPLLRFGVYHFVFSYLFVSKLHKFTLYLLTGVFFYNFFSDITSSAINAVRSRSRLTKTIYFPRYLLVFSSSLTAVFSFTINVALIWVVVMIFDHVSFYQIFTVVPFVLLILFGTGIGLILSILFVHFRDITEIWGVLLTLGFWLTPIMYDPKYVPEPLANVALLNPIGRILVLLRAYLVYGDVPSLPFFLSTSLLCIGIFIFGLWLFQRYEHRIPEYVS
ncbi:MAG: ABC transporter permease [Bacteroidota bacterium]|nr:ABC transporter permease [Bacteroidota bacterium]